MITGGNDDACGPGGGGNGGPGDGGNGGPGDGGNGGPGDGGNGGAGGQPQGGGGGNGQTPGGGSAGNVSGNGNSTPSSGGFITGSVGTRCSDETVDRSPISFRDARVPTILNAQGALLEPISSCERRAPVLSLAQRDAVQANALLVQALRTQGYTISDVLAVAAMGAHTVRIYVEYDR